jgi:Flp pilus assembly CpaF family ATPase
VSGGAGDQIPKEVFEETLLQFFAPIRPYLDDPTVSDIMINGPDQIYVEKKGKLYLVPAKFETRERDERAAHRGAPERSPVRGQAR